MKIPLLVLLALLAVTSKADEFSYSLSSQIAELSFIQNGKLTVVYTLNQAHVGVGKSLVYSAAGKTCLLDGTPSSIQNLIRSEFPQGPSSDFIRDKFPYAIVSLISSAHYYIVTDRMIGIVKNYCQQHPADLQAMRCYRAMQKIQVGLGGGTWNISVMYVTEEGRLYLSKIIGRSNPFIVRSVLTETVEENIPASLLIDY